MLGRFLLVVVRFDWCWVGLTGAGYVRLVLGRFDWGWVGLTEAG